MVDTIGYKAVRTLSHSVQSGDRSLGANPYTVNHQSPLETHVC